MKVDKYLKSHKANEFYVKKCRGYYLVMDSYDKSCPKKVKLFT